MEQENIDFKILTDYILSMNLWDDFDFDLIEEWAIELINLGYESEALCTLATFYKPINSNEIMPYLKRTFLELNLKEKDQEETKVCYIRYHLSKIAKKEDIRKHFEYAEKFYIGNGMQIEQNLNFLDEMWLDMKYNVDSCYNAMKINNSEQIVIEKAKLWLEMNPLN
jgi:hypothetical protein